MSANQEQKKDRKPNPRFDAMKLKQQPIQDEINKNNVQIHKMSDEIKMLQQNKEGKYVAMNKEGREEMIKLSDDIKKIKVANDELQATFDTLLAAQKDLRKTLPKSVTSEEAGRKEIDQLSYILEHDKHSIQEEKEIKAKITALEKSLVNAPAIEKNNAKMTEIKEKQKKLREELKPLVEKKQKNIAEQQKELEKFMKVKTEQGDLKTQIDVLFEKKKALIEVNKQLHEKCNEIYAEFEKQQEAAKVEYEQKKAQMKVRDEMQPLLDKLADMGVRAFEEPRWSSNFQITPPQADGDYDPNAQDKAGMIAWLELQLQEKKAEAKGEEKELSKEEKKRLRQQANKSKKAPVDLSVNLWMEGLGLKSEDIETPEQKRAVVEKLRSGNVEEKERQKEEKKKQYEDIIEQLKGKGATIVLK
ncbi:Conserved_hypothetical protein [Hexamita inflata]|uniref:Viral A-type inclusion protein n=1 Tax=Hexamita inflata TaxID=28002 RepID=A0ABP1HHI2_9EUKA